MFLGSSLLALSSLLQLYYIRPALPNFSPSLTSLAPLSLLVYHTIVTPFSNSYLISQLSSYSLSLSLSSLSVLPTHPQAPLILAIPLLSRLHETFVKGHGADLTTSLPFLHPLTYTLSLLLLLLLLSRIHNPPSFTLLAPLLTLLHWLTSSKTLGLTSFLLLSASFLYHLALKRNTMQAASDLLQVFILLTGPAGATSALILSLQGGYLLTLRNFGPPILTPLLRIRFVHYSGHPFPPAQ